MAWRQVSEALSTGHRMSAFDRWLDVRAGGLSFVRFMDHAPQYGAVVHDGINERLSVSDDALCYLYQRFDGRAWKLAPFQHASAEIYQALACAPVNPWDAAPEFFREVGAFLPDLGFDFEANRDARNQAVYDSLYRLGIVIDDGRDILGEWSDSRGRFLCAALSPWLNGTEIAHLVCAKWPSGDRSITGPWQRRSAVGCDDGGEFEPRFLPVRAKDCFAVQPPSWVAALSDAARPLRASASLGAWRNRPRDAWWEIDLGEGDNDHDAV